MMDMDLYRLIGLGYTVVGLGMLLQPAAYERMTRDFANDLPALYLGGLLALIAGFLLVQYHNIWMLDWPVLITIFGWLALLKGAWILIAPLSVATVVQRCCGSRCSRAKAVGILAFGLLCLWLGLHVRAVG